MERKNVMKPGKKALFLRRFLPWQIYRFVVINIRMLRMMSKGH